MRYPSRAAQARWLRVHKRRLDHYLRRLLRQMRHRIDRLAQEHQLDFLISVSGMKRSGKDTVADVFPWPTVRMAGELRRGIHTLTGVPPEQSATDAGKAELLPCWARGGPRTLVPEMRRVMNQCYPPSSQWPEHVQEIRARQSCFVWTHASDIMNKRPLPPPEEQVWRADDVKEAPNVTVGAGLQVLGTEVGRKLWNEDVWTEAYKREVADRKLTSWKTPDTRFDNEGKALNDIEREAARDPTRRRRLIKLSWLVTRPSLLAPASGDKLKDGRLATHESETYPKNYKFDHVLVNNKTLAHLYRTALAQFESSVAAVAAVAA